MADVYLRAPARDWRSLLAFVNTALSPDVRHHSSAAPRARRSLASPGCVRKFTGFEVPDTELLRVDLIGQDAAGTAASHSNKKKKKTKEKRNPQQLPSFWCLSFLSCTYTLFCMHTHMCTTSAPSIIFLKHMCFEKMIETRAVCVCPGGRGVGGGCCISGVPYVNMCW